MDVYEVKRGDLIKFLESISEDTELIAPFRKDLVRFETATKDRVKDIYLSKNAYFPIKEYFFRKHEKIFDFTKKKLSMPVLEMPKRVFFGLRRCDLNGIMHQDRMFLEVVHDPYYAAMRKNSVLIGYHCNEAPSKYCFCGTLGLKDFFDIMVFDRKDKFLIEVGTDKGKDIIRKHGKTFKKSNVKITDADKKIKNADRLLKPDISKLYDHKDWQKGVNDCLSCAACTNLCPTCYCFEFHDKLNADGSGSREREWSSCQLQDFTRVAGDHVFREKREERFKHRIYHQLDYHKQKYGEHLCVGCGRCIEGCPTRIDFVAIINEMK